MPSCAKLRPLFACVAALAIGLWSNVANATTFFVTQIGDNGLGTLRQAILDANANPGADTIQFNLGTITNPPTFINLQTALPTITGDLTIVGPGASFVNVQPDPILHPPPFSLFIISGTPTVEIRGLSMTHGNAPDGGAIAAVGGTLTVRECSIFENGATNSGGAIALNGAGNCVLNVIDSSIFANTAVNRGGGIAVVRTSGAATVNISGSTLGRNTATGTNLGQSGGGLHVSGGAGPHTITITGSTLNDNAVTTDGSGGGVFLDAVGGSMNLTNATVSGNAAGAGSAVAFTNASLTIRSCTFTANNASNGNTESSIQDVNNIGMSVKNTILSGNIAFGGFRDLAAGQLATGNNNLVGIGGPFINGVNGNIVGVTNPRLVPLNSNGGTSLIVGLQPATFALQPDSPALDAGSNVDAPPVDERGQMRPTDGDNNGVATADIGAFETQRYLVTTDVNSGVGSLRQAIIDNNTAGGGFVKFAIPSIGQQKTIQPKSPYPTIVRTIYVDAWSQGLGNYQGPPLIELDGFRVQDTIGLDIQASDCIIRGMSINNFAGLNGNGVGIKISTSRGGRNWIYGNYIGVRPDGVTPQPNGQFGVWIAPAANTNIIGTNADNVRDALEGNVISGSTHDGLRTGVYVESNSNIIAGNRIGTDVTGTVAIPNFNGIWVRTGSSNQIGTSSFSQNQAAERNIIAGNLNVGISFTSAGSNNFVSGNYIGFKADGSAALPNLIGVLLDNVNRVLIGGTSIGERNVISGNLQHGVIASGTGAFSNLVQGNFIGTNPTGTAAVGNGFGGVLVRGGVTFMRIGAFGDNSGIDPSRRNVISGNGGPGVTVQDSTSSDNRVMGNFIGLAQDGRTPLGNLNAGVLIQDSPANQVGAPGTGRNVIGGQISLSSGDGVTISGQAATGNKVRNNLIGVAEDGTPIGNGAAGVTVMGGASGTFVGGTQLGDGNTIANNNVGVRVLDDNSQADSILGNSIDNNTRLGIDLKDDGVTPNAPANVVRVGPNGLPNYPILTAVLPSGQVSARLASKGSTWYRIEYFAQPTPDPSAFGEGRTFLGFRNVFTDSTGNVGPFNFAASVPPGQNFVSATATELAPADSFGFPTQPGAPLGTSEFSRVLAINTAPSTVNQFASTFEDTDVVITLTATDPDPNPTFTFRIASLPTLGQLLQFGTLTPITAAGTQVDDSLGRVVFRPGANDFGTPYATFDFIANDGLADSNQSTVTIDVLPVPDTPSVTNSATLEDVQTTTGLVISRNPVDGTEVTHFKITAITNGTLFQNDGITPIVNGQFITFAQGNAGLRFTPAPNFVGNGTFNVQASLNNTNAGIGGGTATATIVVSPVADTPSVTDASTLEDTQSTSGLVITRNAADGSEVSHFRITALTTGQLFQNDGVTPITNGQFITAAQGAAGLRYTPPPDFNGPVTFQVQASIGNTPSGLGGSLVTATITVIPVNDPPTFVAANPPAVLEDSGAATVAGWVTSFIPGPPNESSQTVLGYTVSAITNPSLFSTAPTVDVSGTLRYTPAPDANGTSQFTVVVRDNGGTANGGIDTSAPQTFTITVIPVNDRPSFVAADPPPVLEDSGAATVVGWATNFIPGPPNESTQTILGYSVSAVTNGSLFSVQPTVDNAGTLRYTPAPDANGTSQFTVVVRDNGGTDNGGIDTSLPHTFTITVIPVNDRPSFTAANPPPVLEDSGPATVTGWVTNFTPGPSNESTQTVLGYTVSGVTNGSLFSVPPTVDNAGTLRYTPAPDANGTSQFTVVVRDNGGTDNGGIDTSFPQTFTITVIPVNDRPNFTAANPPPVLEDSGSATVVDWVTNFTPGPANESGQAVLGYSVSAISNPALFSSLPTVDISGTLRYTPAPDANGTSQFTVVVRDNGGTDNGGIDTSFPQTFTITVVPVNDRPSFIAANPPPVLEDSGPATVPGWVTSFIPGPPNESGQMVLGYTVSAVTNGSLFSVAPTVDNTGTLRYTPAPDANGTSQFTVVVRDDGGTDNGGIDTSLPQTFTITVIPVNDKPAFTAAAPPAVLEASGAHFVAPFITSFTPGPANESGQQIAAVLVDQVSNPSLFTVPPTVSISGQLTYTLASSGFGTSTFRVRVQDNGGTDNGGVDTSDPQMFTIIVRPMAVCHDVTIDARTTCVALTVQPNEINFTPTAAGPGATQAITFSRPLTVNFPIGVTPVTVTATYSDGLVSSCVARVTVLATDCNANGIPDSCETLLGGLTDCNGDAIPDDCQCLWDDGMVFPTDAPAANGLLSHYGNQVAMKVADDFYLRPDRMYRLFEFKGQLITNTLIHKARLEFFEDCDGRPADQPFKTFVNSVEDASVAAAPGYQMITYSFNLCSDCFFLEGGKSYWVSLVGVTDFVNPGDASYWATTTPLANPAGVMGMPPVRRQGFGGPPPYPVTFEPWVPSSTCCNGCVNLAWKLTGEECLVAWDNGKIDLNTSGPAPTAGGSPCDFDTAIPYLPRTADNFIVSGCDTVQVCYLETYIWTNCNPVRGFVEIFGNDCNQPGATPLFSSQATRAELIPGATTVIGGLTLNAYKLVFCAPPWTLAPGKNYWISSGTQSGGSITGRGLFAYSAPDCRNPSCTQTRLSPGRFLDHSITPLTWTETGHEFAFKMAVRGTMGLGTAQPAPVVPTCAPDFNGDHLLNAQDIFDYLSAWFAGCH